jgi:hypothetical protein
MGPHFINCSVKVVDQVRPIGLHVFWYDNNQIFGHPRAPAAPPVRRTHLYAQIVDAVPSIRSRREISPDRIVTNLIWEVYDEAIP